MSGHYQDESVVLHHGDCLDVMRGLPDRCKAASSERTLHECG